MRFCQCSSMVCSISGLAVIAGIALATMQPLNAHGQSAVPGSPPPSQLPPELRSHPALPQAPIEMVPAELDLGTVPPETTVTGVTLVRNVGNEPIRLVSSRANCTCTRLDVEHRSIAPGENLPVTIHFRTTQGMGHKKTAVRLQFDGFELFEIPLTAHVSLPVGADPAYISALPDELGNPQLSGEYVVASLDKRPFRVLAVNGSPPNFVDFNSSADEPRNSYTLKWDFSGYDPTTCTNAKGERLPQFIVVETDHPECPVFDLEVRHECVRRTPPMASDTWILQEKRVLLGLLEEGKPVERTVETRWYPKRPQEFPIEMISSMAKDFKVEMLSVTPTPEGHSVKLRFTLTPGHKGTVYGTAYLQSQRQAAPLIVIGTAR